MESPRPKMKRIDTKRWQECADTHLAPVTAQSCGDLPSDDARMQMQGLLNIALDNGRLQEVLQSPTEEEQANDDVRTEVQGLLQSAFESGALAQVLSQSD